MIGFCVLKYGNAINIAIRVQGSSYSLLSSHVLSDRSDHLLSCIFLHREEPTVVQLRCVLLFVCLALICLYQTQTSTIMYYYVQQYHIFAVAAGAALLLLQLLLVWEHRAAATQQSAAQQSILKYLV